MGFEDRDLSIPLTPVEQEGHSPLVLIEVLDNAPGDNKQQGNT